MPKGLRRGKRRGVTTSRTSHSITEPKSSSIRIKSDGDPMGEFVLEDGEGNPIDLPIISIKWEMTNKTLGRLILVIEPVEINAEAMVNNSEVEIPKEKKSMNMLDFLESQKKKRE